MKVVFCTIVGDPPPEAAAGAHAAPFHVSTCPLAGAVFDTVLPWSPPTVVLVLPALEVTSPVRAGIRAAGTVPADRSPALPVVATVARPLTRAAGTVPVVTVPRVVMFVEPDQVDNAVFSTLPRPKLVRAFASVVAPVPPLATASVHPG